MTPIPGSGARCCDAGSGVVSPASLSVSPYLCGQMLWRRLRGRVSRLSPCVSQSLRSDARCCDAGSGVVSPARLPVSHAVALAAGLCLPLVSLCLCGRMAAGCGVVSPACLPMPVSPSLCGQMPDAGSRVGCPACLPLSPSLCSQMPDALVVCPTWLPGFVSPPCLPVSQSVQSDARCCDAGCGVLSCLPLVSLCPAKTLRSDPRRCDAGCGVVSCTCLPVSPSLRGQMPDAVTLAPGRVSRLSPSFSHSRSDARCWDAGSGVVSPACLPVSPSWLFV